MTQIDATLSQICARFQNSSLDKDRAFVFDIDSTLFCVSTRTQAILKELAIQPDFQKDFPELSHGIEKMTVLKTDWGARQAIQRLNIPIPEKAVQQIKSFWNHHFFSNDFLTHDLLYNEANHFVRHLSQFGEIFYLTGRSQALMETGTIKQLLSFKFPLKDQSHLIMKDKTYTQDDEFKVDKLRPFVKTYDEVYFFENEPLIIESVENQLPEVKIIFMNSTHSSRRPSPTHLPTISPDSYKIFKDNP